MKGVSYIVASILMLIITVALSGTAYMFISGVFTAGIQGIEIADAYCSLGEVSLSIKNIGSTTIGALEIEQTNPKVDDILARDFQGAIDPGKAVRYTDTCEGEQSRRCIYRVTPPVGKTIVGDVICSGRPESLVAAWHFDESSGTETKDSSGYGNDGTTYSGAVPTDLHTTDGKYGKGLEFDGVNDFVNVSHSESLNFGTNDFTIEAWLKAEVGSRVNVPMAIGKMDIDTQMNGWTLRIFPDDGLLWSYVWGWNIYPWWNHSWPYRKSHTISGSSAGNQTNYAINIIVINGTGTDSGATVYIDNKTRSDFGDIRFTWYNDTSGREVEIDYWNETMYEGDNATFWVEVPFISNVIDNTIYIYYGNGDETTTSNGTNTFVFYDEFNADNWLNLGGAGHTVAGGQMTATGTTEGLVYRDIALSNGIVFTWEHVSSATDFWGVSTIHNDGVNVQSGYLFDLMQGSGWGIFYGDGTSWNIIGSATDSVNKGTIVEIHRFGDQLKLYVDGTLKVTRTHSTLTSGRVGFRQVASRNKVIDNVRVRALTDPEPSHGAWGSEEIGLVEMTEVKSKENFDDGVWHHIAVVRNNTAMKLFVDGDEVGKVIGNAINGDSIDSLFIGAIIKQAGITNPWSGVIDEVKIYNKALI